MSVEAIPFPSSAVATSQQAAFTHLTNLTAALRRLLSQLEGADESEIADLQNQINTILAQIAVVVADLAALTATINGILLDLEDIGLNGALTDQQAFILSLVTAVDTIFDSVASGTRTIQTELERNAEATIRAAMAELTTAHRVHVSETGIKLEQTVRQTEDEALAQQILTVSATLTAADAVLQDGIDEVDAAVVSEQTARALADSALATDISTVSAAVSTETANRIAAVTDEATARANADEANAERITTTAATLATDGQQAAETAIRNALGEAGATAGQIIANASIKREETARVSADEALAQSITTLNSSLGVTNATLSTLQTTVATGDAALSAQITTNTTNIAGNTASITTVQSAVDGIYTRWGVILNAQNEVIGSLLLDGTPAGSTFAVNVDNFYVGKVGTSGGTSIPVFAIQTVNSTPAIALRGDLYADGAIIARTIAAAQINAGHIQAGAVTTAKLAAGAVTANEISSGAVTTAKLAAGAVTANEIAAGAITAAKISANTITVNEIAINGLTGSTNTQAVAASSTTSNSNSFLLLSGMEITLNVAANEKLHVMFTGSYSGISQPAAFEIWMDGSRVTDTPTVYYPVAYDAPNYLPILGASVNFNVVLSPSAGSHTFQVRWANLSSNPTTFLAYNDYRYFSIVRFLR